MFYNADPDPYIDYETGILRNLLNITIKQELEDAEAAITSAAIASIPDQPPIGNFSLGHLQDIHWELFNVIYSWAGDLRTIEIAKDNTRFANSDIIEQVAHNVFKELHAENLLKDLQRGKYIQRLAHFYSEINVLHPFREGNGRTQRVFFSQLVAQSGYRLAWENLDPKQNLEACIAAYDGDGTALIDMLDELLEVNV